MGMEHDQAKAEEVYALLDADERVELIGQNRGDEVYRGFAHWIKSRRGPYKQSDYAEKRSFLAEAHRLGIRVIVLVMPRSAEAEALLDNDDRRLISQRMTEYRKAFGVVELRYPGKLSTADFFDYSHLNQEGRDKFSRWLLKALLEMQRGAGG